MTLDTAPVMRFDARCFWNQIGKGVCGKSASHGTMIRDGVYYLCNYHAGVARRDGWRGVKPLKKAGTP